MQTARLDGVPEGTPITIISTKTLFSFFSSKEAETWQAFLDLGGRPKIEEMSRYFDTKYKTALGRVYKASKLGVFVRSAAKGLHEPGRQSVQIYNLCCVPLDESRVLITEHLLSNLQSRKRRGRPIKHAACVHEIANTEQINRPILVSRSETTEQINRPILVQSQDRRTDKYTDTCACCNSASAHRIENQITPLRGLLHAGARTREIKLNIKFLRDNIKLLRELNLKKNELARGFFSFEKEKNALRAILFTSTESDHSTLIPCTPTEFRKKAITLSSSKSQKFNAANGSRFGGTSFDTTWMYEGVPPYPTIQLVRPIEVPAPPRINPSWTEDEQIAFFARAWTTAIEHKTGQPCWLLRNRRQGRGKKQKLVSGIDKHREELLAAIKLCIEHKLQPGPWIAFSYDEWVNVLSKSERTEATQSVSSKTKSRRRKRRKSAVIPPIRWVFSESRIVDRAGWYGHVLERELYRGTIRFTTKHRKLIRLHTAMRFALMALSSPTKAEVDKIVDRFLPERYELLVRQCNSETAREQERLSRRAREGEWLWR
jgi:hypothetical protein